MESGQSESMASHDSRRRAPQACLSCRARKVRCDVVHRDGRCTNCALDNRQCIVKARPTRYRSKKPETNQAHLRNRPTDPPSAHGFIAGNELANDAGVLLGTPSDSSQVSPLTYDRSSTASSSVDTPYDYRPPNTRALLRSYSIQHTQCTNTTGQAEAQLHENNIKNSHVIYSYFPFLRVDLSQLSEEDVDFLESQDCLRVPSRQLSDEFIREYFLHVHPGLPMLDESRFWKMYAGTGVSENSFLSLFVFQAMLFASSGYVSLSTIQKLGFDSIRTARGEYYRRAKLLFDLCAEKDLVSSCQGSLLLSYNATMRDRKRVNSIWLSTAIHMIQAAGANEFHTKPNEDPYVQNTLKRLWWCCIVRDRILPLGVRRQLSISLEGIDLSRMALTQEDFSEEIQGSHVYDAETKIALTHTFIALCDLCVSLTDVILTIYPTGGATLKRLSSLSNIKDTLDHVQSCKLALESWSNRTTLGIQNPARMVTNKSVILFSNLVKIYYHSACLALYQYESLILAVRSFGLEYEEPSWHHIKFRLENATACITDNLKEIIHLQMGKYIPISIVAYAATPLALHILDVKLSSSPSQLIHKQSQLKVYLDAMKSFQAQYDGTDEVWDFIKTVIDYVTPRRTPQRISGSDHKTHSDPPTHWGCIFLHEPALFFHLTHTVDISLSNGKYSEDSNFPLALRLTRVSLSRISLGNIYNGYAMNEGQRQSDHDNSDEALFNIKNNLSSQDCQKNMTNALVPGLASVKNLDDTLYPESCRLHDSEFSSYEYDYGLEFDGSDAAIFASHLPI